MKFVLANFFKEILMILMSLLPYSTIHCVPCWIVTLSLSIIILLFDLVFHGWTTKLSWLNDKGGMLKGNGELLKQTSIYSLTVPWEVEWRFWVTRHVVIHNWEQHGQEEAQSKQVSAKFIEMFLPSTIYLWLSVWLMILENSSPKKLLISGLLLLNQICLPITINATSTVTASCFSEFNLLSESEVFDLITASSKNSCPFDPISTKFLTECVDVLLSPITKIIN